MEQYDDIVVGSGVSGLTVALLLGLNGRKVLLLEKSPQIGGSLRRFYKDGVPLDVGFHFTGGFGEGGMLSAMLRVLGIAQAIKPQYLHGKNASQLVLEKEGKVYEMPIGHEATIARLGEYFPNDRAAIAEYFNLAKRVCDKTVTMADIRTISVNPEPLDEDFITLQALFDRLKANRDLQAFLAAYNLCYGVKPEEISFANHARVCYNLYEAIARVEGGGEAFIAAFKEQFKKIDITVKCSAFIEKLEDVKNTYAERFILNTGEEIVAQSCIFTLHPKQILEILPKEHLSKAFISRVENFERSIGFFSLFGVIDDPKAEDFQISVVSLLPDNDFNFLFSPEYKGDPALAIMKSKEEYQGKTSCVISAFEVSFFEQVAVWQNTKLGKRGKDYEEYKRVRTESILKRLFAFYPQYKKRLRVLDVSSQLTFRDYLNSPDGCAYGIKQKIGQYNLFGKLPIRNIYAAGQSAVLPGIMGAMLASFIVARAVIGKEKFNVFIGKQMDGKG
jgi:phytoene dehydrogenase-like protein